MKKLFTLTVFMAITLIVCGQKSQTFDRVVTFNAGFRFTETGTVYTSMPASADWNTLLNKPAVFIPDLSITNPLYKPISYSPTWDEITGKPQEQELSSALSQLNGIRLPVLTTAQINALPPQMGLLVYDSSLNVLKIHNGVEWKIIITNQ